MRLKGIALKEGSGVSATDVLETNARMPASTLPSDSCDSPMCDTARDFRDRRSGAWSAAAAFPSGLGSQSTSSPGARTK
jgi:hypothetical protein